MQTRPDVAAALGWSHVRVPEFPSPGWSLSDAAPGSSVTATATCLMRAVEQARAPHLRLVEDPYTRLFLPEPLRFVARYGRCGRPG
jgi:hypothetical protein